MRHHVKAFGPAIAIYILQLVGERFLTNAPEWVWTALFWIAIVWAIVAALSYWERGWRFTFGWLPRIRIEWSDGTTFPKEIPAIRGMVMPGHRIALKSYMATIDGRSLMDFQNDYRFALVSGINNPTTDKYEQTLIVVSSAFTIRPEPINVLNSFTKEMNAITENATKEVVEEFKRTNPDAKGSLLIEAEIPIFNEVILLPNNVDPSKVTRLSDVSSLGGKIISREIQEGRFRSLP